MCIRDSYTKCPKCLTLSDTFTNECPVCHSNIDHARRQISGNLRDELKPYDILEGGYGVWLQAHNIEMGGDEQVIIIFPKGNFLTPGPAVIPMIYAEEGPKTDCNVVLTDKRFIISFDDKIMSSELQHIDSCVVSDTGTVSYTHLTLPTN